MRRFGDLAIGQGDLGRFAGGSRPCFLRSISRLPPVSPVAIFLYRTVGIAKRSYQAGTAKCNLRDIQDVISMADNYGRGSAKNVSS